MEQEKLDKQVKLLHLLVDKNKMIGLQFYPDKVIQSLIKELPDIGWSKRHNMACIPNNEHNVRLVFNKFRGVAWVNCKQFFFNKPITNGNVAPDVDLYRNRIMAPHYKPCPESYLQKLELRKYANNTVKTYVNCFEKFINYYKNYKLSELSEIEVRKYLQHLIRDKKSDSYINQSINSIKFYYEQVLNMPNRFYDIERPIKKEKLPSVLSKEDIKQLIEKVNNLKHYCIISMLYSSGIRRSELINLKISDIDSKRMVIRVENGKGGKDRYTLLSTKMLKLLRKYFVMYKPKHWLFEGVYGQQYSPNSVLNVVKRAGVKSGINKRVTPHILRHSFATHLIESGTDIRYIQNLLGHSSTKTTEIYTYVATNILTGIKNPLDSL